MLKIFTLMKYGKEGFIESCPLIYLLQTLLICDFLYRQLYSISNQYLILHSWFSVVRLPQSKKMFTRFKFHRFALENALKFLFCVVAQHACAKHRLVILFYSWILIFKLLSSLKTWKIQCCAGKSLYMVSFLYFEFNLFIIICWLLIFIPSLQSDSNLIIYDFVNQ